MPKRYSACLLLCCSLFLSACAGYQSNKKEALLSIPELGAIIEVQQDLTYSESMQIGIPEWGVVPLEVRAIPFDKSSYGQLVKSMQRSGKEVILAFNDSLAKKPC